MRFCFWLSTKDLFRAVRVGLNNRPDGRGAAPEMGYRVPTEAAVFTDIASTPG